MEARFTFTRDRRLFAEILARARQARPVLRQWGALIKAAVKKQFKEKAPPRAASTEEKRATTGTSSVTAQGKIRASYAANLDRKLKRKGNEDARAALRELRAGNLTAKSYNRTVDRLRRRLQAAQAAKDIGARVAIGKRQSERNQDRGGKMAGAFKAIIRNFKVTVENAARYSKVHDEGGRVGHGAVLPTWGFAEITASTRAALADVAVKWLVGGKQ